MPRIRIRRGGVMNDVLQFPIGGVLERGDEIELAMRLIFEDELRTGERPVTDEAGVYHTWNGDRGIWEPADEVAIKCRVDEFAGAPVEGSKGPYPLKMREGAAGAVHRVMQRHTWRPGFFRDDVLAFQGQMVAFVAGNEIRIEPARAAHGARTLMDARIDEEPPDQGRGSLLSHYLSTTFEDEDEHARIQEIMGAALFGLGTRFKKAWFFTDHRDMFGQGGTGKSQLLDMIWSLVPSSRRCSVAPQDFRDDTKVILLYGKTLNLVFEAPASDIIREETVKAIVHGEYITKRQVYERPMTFAPMALHVFATNELPDAPGATGAFWDRWEVIEFRRRFRETSAEIPHIGKKIVEQELALLIQFALRGARRLLKQKGYTASAAGADVLTHWRHRAEPVARFVSEWTHPVESDVQSEWTSGSSLFKEFQDWCKENGHSAMSSTKFGTRLSRIVEKTRSNGAKYRIRLLTRMEREIREGQTAWEEF